MSKLCAILILFVFTGCSISYEKVHESSQKALEVSSIDRKHCVEIGNKAAAAWVARGNAMPGKAVKDRILAEYRNELIYRKTTEEVKNKLLQMTEYVVNKAYEWKPPFKTESDAKNFGKEYCEKNL